MPNIGDLVEVTYLVGATLTTDSGALGVELDAEEHVVGIVLTTDGGATHIAPSTIVSLKGEPNGNHH